MKIFITILFIFILSSEGKAQTDTISSTDKKINNKTKELKNDKVDTIICYHINCIGEVRIEEDSCVAYDVKYLLWSNHRKHYIQRFDECKEHQSASTGSVFFSLLKSRYYEIQKLKIKYPEYKKRVNGKMRTYYSFIDHSCHYIFEIYTNTNILKKDIDDYALETKYDDEKNLNRNFYSNQKSILNKLKIAVKHDVDVYNKNH